MTAATFAQITHAERISQARSILDEVSCRLHELASSESRACVSYMASYGAQCVIAYGLIAGGDLDPLELPVPDELRDDDERGAALEAASDQALQGARAAWKRLDEALRREAAVAARDGGN